MEKTARRTLALASARLPRWRTLGLRKSLRPRVVLLQTALPAYRIEPVRLLLERLGSSAVGYVGDAYFDPSIRTAAEIHPLCRPVRNHYLFGRRILWQTGCWRMILAAETAVFELNPRILSSWVMLLARKFLRGRRNVLWGHAWPRRGPAARSDFARHPMRVLADVLVVYTEEQAAQLRSKMPTKPVIAAPNALYRRSVMKPLLQGIPENFIFTGRLVPSKKPSLLVHAFAVACSHLPAKAQLVIVGDGPQRSELEQWTKTAGISSRVDFRGEVTAWADLRDLYLGVLASVSPGYVGLSLIQSLGFGVPMIIARDEPHSPELEAADLGRNCLMFESDSTDGLAQALVSVSTDAAAWRSRRTDIAAQCASRYSVEVMVDRMLDALSP